jgi:hypothetical protein
LSVQTHCCRFCNQELPRDVIHSTAHFRRHVHTLHCETAARNQSNSPLVTCVMLMHDS